MEISSAILAATTAIVSFEVPSTLLAANALPFMPAVK
jgi:hypothetical protein